MKGYILSETGGTWISSAIFVLWFCLLVGLVLSAASDGNVCFDFQDDISFFRQR